MNLLSNGKKDKDNGLSQKISISSLVDAAPLLQKFVSAKLLDLNFENTLLLRNIGALILNSKT